MTGVTRGCPQRHLPRVAYRTSANLAYKRGPLVSGHDVNSSVQIASFKPELAIAANPNKVLMDQAVSDRSIPVGYQCMDRFQDKICN